MQWDNEHGGLAALLAWYREMGVDAALGDEPVDWLARGDAPPGAGIAFAAPEAAPASQAPPQLTSPPAAPTVLRKPVRPAPTTAAAPQTDPRRFATQPPDAAETSARAAARQAADLNELRAALDRFDGCGLKTTAKSTCFYRGSPQARLMIIGEAPGRDEDIEGKPFVGRAGQLLDRMLMAIGLDESHVHITNIVYWRPPGNRTPTPQEAQVCRPFLERQIELVSPAVLMLLGGPAMKHILDLPDGIMRVRGKWRDVSIGNHVAKAMPTLHPAYLLRTPAAKRLAWRDLLLVRQALDAA
jgi:DNA polymerase